LARAPPAARPPIRAGCAQLAVRAARAARRRLGAALRGSVRLPAARKATLVVVLRAACSHERR
jgi:hypothetical protein